jgi:hypothetical protein
MPLGNGDFIQRDDAQVVQTRPSKTALQITLLHVLDHIPANPELQGDVFDGHAPRKFQGVTLERPRVSTQRVRKAKANLTNQTTTPATNALRGAKQIGGLMADGQGPKATDDSATLHNIVRSAGRTTEEFRLWSDDEKHLPFKEMGLHVLVAAQPEGMVD